MKKGWGIGLAALIGVVVLVLLLWRPFQTAPQEVQVGAILPLTGDGANYGKKLKMGIELALSAYKGSYAVTVNYEDSKAQPQDAVTSYLSLRQRFNISAVVGLFSSSEVLAVAPLVNRDKVVLISPTASSPVITGAGDYIFRVVTSDEYDGKVVAHFIRTNLNLSSASVAYINNDYGVGVRDAFSINFARLGGKVLVSEAFAQDSNDFRAQIEKLRAADPPIIFLIGYKEMGRFLRQARELGLKNRFISIGLFEDPEIIKTAAGAAEGVHYSMPGFDISQGEAATQSFRVVFQGQFNSEPDIVSALGYDAMSVLLVAIDGSRGKSSGLRDALQRVGQFHGAAGTFVFDENGDVQKPYGIKKVQGGTFQWVVKNLDLRHEPTKIREQ